MSAQAAAYPGQLSVRGKIQNRFTETGTEIGSAIFQEQALITGGTGIGILAVECALEGDLSDQASASIEISGVRQLWQASAGALSSYRRPMFFAFQYGTSFDITLQVSERGFGNANSFGSGTASLRIISAEVLDLNHTLLAQARALFETPATAQANAGGSSPMHNVNAE